MKTYKVTVNGTAYEITLEAVDAASVATPAPAPAPATATATAPVAAPAAPAPVANAGGETVNAPMPGNILSVKVSVGTQVKKGDVLVVLEAMKMENDIISPCDGTVTSVGVTNGTSVETGAVLCTIA